MKKKTRMLLSTKASQAGSCRGLLTGRTFMPYVSWAFTAPRGTGSSPLPRTRWARRSRSWCTFCCTTVRNNCNAVSCRPSWFRTRCWGIKRANTKLYSFCLFRPCQASPLSQVTCWSGITWYIQEYNRHPTPKPLICRTRQLLRMM